MIAGWLGWIGTAGTFAAYALLWRGQLSADSRKYAALNIMGGLLGGIASALYGAWPSTASNLTWAAVGLHSLIGETRSRRAPNHAAISRVARSPEPMPMACGTSEGLQR